MLFDDLDNAVGPRIDQDGAAVHNRVTVIPGAIFRRHILVVDALIRQHPANPYVLAILIGRTVLLGSVIAKARTLLDAENPGDATEHPANDTADHGADGTGGSFAVS